MAVCIMGHSESNIVTVARGDVTLIIMCLCIHLQNNKDKGKQDTGPTIHPNEYL